MRVADDREQPALLLMEVVRPLSGLLLLADPGVAQVEPAYSVPLCTTGCVSPRAPPSSISSRVRPPSVISSGTPRPQVIAARHFLDDVGRDLAWVRKQPALDILRVNVCAARGQVVMLLRAAHDRLGGPIPAQAGEPAMSEWVRIDERAYPRAGGGTRGASGPVRTTEGLSPRRRGNRTASPPRVLRQGPIPAQAGEPCRGFRGGDWPRAYPRAGGGTLFTLGIMRSCRGLSPRRRGNRLHTGMNSAREGPIPAQAGEPVERTPGNPSVRAYPRAGGGTMMASASRQDVQGLSPRRRGNLSDATSVDQVQGPIPAQAGEPGLRRSTRPRGGAYPRAGGGTVQVSWRMVTLWGLSPRRRGNHPGAFVGDRSQGPIPAQAGEPLAHGPTGIGFRAYPRAGGGTLLRALAYRLGEGLSPRRRGNPLVPSL